MRASPRIVEVRRHAGYRFFLEMRSSRAPAIFACWSRIVVRPYESIIPRVFFVADAD